MEEVRAVHGSRLDLTRGYTIIYETSPLDRGGGPSLGLLDASAERMRQARKEVPQDQLRLKQRLESGA